MALTEAQKLAFAEWMKDTLKENKSEIEAAALKNKGVKFDTDGYIASIKNKEDAYEGEEGKVTTLKRYFQNQ